MDFFCILVDLREFALKIAPVWQKLQLGDRIVDLFFRRQLSLWVTGCCCHKMAKEGKLEPWNWHILVQLL